jgi:carbonic anhydrase
VLKDYPDASRDELQKRLEEENIRLGLKRLLTYPWIRERVGNGNLTLHGWHYAIATGILAALNPETERFGPIA